MFVKNEEKLIQGVANEICGADAEERALVIGTMNAVAYAFNAWLPLLVTTLVLSGPQADTDIILNRYSHKSRILGRTASVSFL